MLTIIRNYDLEDVKRGMNYLLDKASQSEEVRQLAVNIIDNKPDSIAAIYDWVRDNVRYTPDPILIELLTSPVRMVNDYLQGKPLAEDCDGIAILITALCRSIGIQSSVVLLDTKGEGLDHAISQVHSDIGWVSVDASDSIHPLGWSISYYNSYYNKVIV